MNKGQQRMIKNAKNAVSGVMSGISHGLGFTTKSLSEMTAQEVKDLISDIYFSPEALEQIENTINGRQDKKGPLSKLQRRTVASDPVLTAVVKKMCIAKALSEETLGTWNNVWEGVDISRSNVGEVSACCNNIPNVIDNMVKKGMRDKRTAKGFIEEMNKIMSTSIAESIKMFPRIDKSLEAIGGAQNLGKKQRAQILKTVDAPTIPIIEKMNGSSEHVGHATTFYSGVEGKFDFLKMPTGPYTYRELAKIVMTKDSKRCMASFYRLQQDRDYDTMISMPQEDQMLDNEKQYIGDAKTVFDNSMAQSAEAHKKAISQGEIDSLQAYHDKIEDLRDSEMNARTLYSGVVSNVKFNITQRDFYKKLEEQQKEHEAYVKMQEEHMRQLEEIQARMDARTAAQIQEFLEKYGEELGLNEALRKANAASKGETDGESKPQEGVAVEQVVVDETAIKTVETPNRNEGDAR